MNKLTKDLHTPHDDTGYSDIVENAVDRENIVLTKLKHYEDIEEELGVDLIKLLSAKEIYYKDKTTGEIKSHSFIVDFTSHLLFIRIYHTPYSDDDECFVFGLMFYGDDWAFTRKELEQ